LQRELPTTVSKSCLQAGFWQSQLKGTEAPSRTMAGAGAEDEPTPGRIAAQRTAHTVGPGADVDRNDAD
jgi:hypothetical protein